MEDPKYPNESSESEEKEVLRAEAEQMVNVVDKNPGGYLYSMEQIEKSLQEAEDAGVDVSDLRERMPEIKKKVLRAKAEQMVNAVDKNPDGYLYSMEQIEKSFQEAEDAGVDVSDLRERMPEIEENLKKSQNNTRDKVEGAISETGAISKTEKNKEDTEVGIDTQKVEERFTRFVRNMEMIGDDDMAGREMEILIGDLEEFLEDGENSREDTLARMGNHYEGWSKEEIKALVEKNK